jgi:hypothetical protein
MLMVAHLIVTKKFELFSMASSSNDNNQRPLSEKELQNLADNNLSDLHNRDLQFAKKQTVPILNICCSK